MFPVAPGEMTLRALAASPKSVAQDCSILLPLTPCYHHLGEEGWEKMTLAGTAEVWK